MITPVLLSLTLTFLSGTVFSKVSDKVFIDAIQDIEKRLLDLDNGLDNLISDVSKLKLKLTGETNNGASNPIVDIVTVQRTRVADGFNFSVTYRTRIDDVFVLWVDYQNLLNADSVQTVNIDQNTNMTSVVYPVNNVDSSNMIVVNFFSLKLMSNLDVQLYFSINEKENVTQSIGSIPSLVLGTTGDIVYEKGKNVSLKFRYAPQNNTNPRISAQVVHLQTRKFRIEYPRGYAPTFIEISKSRNAEDKEEINVNFLTSTNYVSGVVDFVVEHFYPEGLVHKINFNQLKVLRPDTETGPFPNLFLHLRENFHRKNENGASIVNYQPGDKTRLYCQAFGPNITNIIWTRHNSDGTYTNISPEYTMDRIPYTFQSGIILATNVTDDVTMKVTCSAQNAFRMNVVDVFELTPWKPVEDDLEPMNISISSFMDVMTENDDAVDAIPTQSPAYGPLTKTENVTPPKSLDYGSFIEPDVMSTPSLSDVHFIEILIASREREGNGFSFSVSYRPRVHDVDVTWFNGTFEFSGVTEQDSTGVKRAMFLYSIENVLFPQLEARISSHGKRSMVVIEFNFSDLLNVQLTEQDVRIPTLEVQTEAGIGGDFIYKIGHNATFKVKSETHQVQADLLSDLVDVATGKFYSGILKPGAFDLNLIEMVKSKVMFNMLEFDFNLTTSKTALSGLLTFYLQRIESGGLINKLKVYKTRALRPLNQKGVFPDRFMTIKKPAKSESAFNAVTHVNCRVEDICLVTCTVLGTNIVNVTLVQVDEDGTKTRVNQTGTITSYSSEVSTTFWVSPTDRQNRTFDCTAKNAQGDVLSEKIVAVPVLTLDILPQLSHVTILEPKGIMSTEKLSESYMVYGPHIFLLLSVYGLPNIKANVSIWSPKISASGKYKPRYNITCTIRSSRRPNVTIKRTSQSSKEDPVLPSNKIRQLSRDIYQVTKIQRFDVKDNSTYLTGVTCMASTPHETVQRDLHVPDVN